MKESFVLAVFSVAVLAPALASAQEIGNKGDAVFSADRLMGITGTHLATDLPPPADEEDWTSISFGWRGSPDSSPYDVPRLSFDYLVIDHLSIGDDPWSLLDADLADLDGEQRTTQRLGVLQLPKTWSRVQRRRAQGEDVQVARSDLLEDLLPPGLSPGQITVDPDLTF